MRRLEDTEPSVNIRQCDQNEPKESKGIILERKLGIFLSQRKWSIATSEMFTLGKCINWQNPLDTDFNLITFAGIKDETSASLESIQQNNHIYIFFDTFEFCNAAFDIQIKCLNTWSRIPVDDFQRQQLVVIVL